MKERSTWWYGILVLPVLILPQQARSQTPEPLAPIDFRVGDLTADMDSTTIRSILGSPDSVVVTDNPFDSGGIPTHFWEDVIISFGYDGTPGGFRLVGSGLATYRGARVGDRAERIMELYGPPRDTSYDHWFYEDPDDIEGLHVVSFLMENGRVKWIYVGWLLD